MAQPTVASIITHMYVVFLFVWVVPQSFMAALKSSSEKKSRKVALSKSEACFMQELIKDHGSDLTVSNKTWSMCLRFYLFGSGGVFHLGAGVCGSCLTWNLCATPPP